MKTPSIFKKKQPVFYTLKSKLIISVMANTILYLFITAIITYIGYSNILNNKISSITETLLNTIDWNLSIMVDDVRDISTIIQDSKEVQSYLSSRVITEETYFDEKRLIRNLVTNITTTKDFINMVYIGNEFSEYFQQTFSKGESYVLNYSDVIESTIAEKLHEGNTRGTWLQGEDLMLPGNNLLLFVKPIIHLNTLEQIGVLIIGINDSVFKSMLHGNQMQNSTIAVASKDDIVYVSQNDILRSDIFATFQYLADKGSAVDYIGQDKFLVNYTTNEFTGWKIISMIQYKSVMKEIYTLLWIILVLIFISLVVSIFIAVALSNKVTKQLRMITRIFDDINCKRPVSILSFSQYDEIGQLGNECIKLFRQNEKLNKNLFELMIKEKEAELMVLQSQINPHFLYNTLDSIFWMAQQDNSENISRMVLSLSKMFRLSLNNGEKYTTIKQELEHINVYLEIQNMRYRGKFKTNIDIDPLILNKTIIRLIIQPIVENSIYHGLEPKQGSGNIGIRGWLEYNIIHLVVEDDGVGFNSSEIAHKGYALNNIDERIKLNYGKEYGITIKSVKNQGTAVTIKIPVIDGGS